MTILTSPDAVVSGRGSTIWPPLPRFWFSCVASARSRCYRRQKISKIVHERLTRAHTSRPSQNSDSVICPDITNSLCRAARSGFFTRTFFRSRKSSDPPGGATEEARSLLETDVARDTDGPERAEGVIKGVPFDLSVDIDADSGAGVPFALLFPIMLVNSFLKASRSASACGLVN